ncbi:secretion-regulating guanine nucleotide exchange factor-like [Pollicipes pollicipes]|uniref:secretion-regulating guanine nucleotide exchange factor-like n=1 Tax=Pollicipes pollicipes TaxID=41117 RepID=UPI001884AB45|nr:secretion-regulating guanine nucleotide exchange factor-like [Pollicipes pollicipes]
MAESHLQLYAWGANSHMQTGTGLADVEQLLEPVAVPLHNIEPIDSSIIDTVLSSATDRASSADSRATSPADGSTLASLDGSTELLPEHASVAVTGGGGHSLLLLAGRVFSCGLNDSGQLARPSEGAADGLFRPVDVGERVVAVSCGWDHSLLLTADGSVYSAGSNRFGQCGLDQSHKCVPDPVRLPLTGVCQVAAGLRHSAAVTVDGCLHLWGDNSRGQTGAAPDRVIWSPRRLAGASAVREVACGQRHTMLISEMDGRRRLYGLGDNSRGQVLGGQASQKPGRLSDLSLVELPDDVTPQRVLCGWTHTLLHCADGSVRGWGRADYGQLSLPAAAARSVKEYNPATDE